MLTVTNVGNKFSDLQVVNAARVSFNKKHPTFAEGKDTRLINYLVKHDHWSPLAHPHATVKMRLLPDDRLDLLLRKDILAGLTIHESYKQDYFAITGSLWALLKLACLVNNHELYWHCAKHCPVSAEAYAMHYGTPFKMDGAKNHRVEEFFTNPDVFCFHVKAPMFVKNQLVKHPVGTVWNEVSRRYVDTAPEFYDIKKLPQTLEENAGVIKPDGWESLLGIRGAAADKKQGSSQEIMTYSHHIEKYITGINSDSGYKYRCSLEMGANPEQTRMMLPQTMITEWYWTGTRESFNRICSLRCAEDAQLETQYIGHQILYHLGQ